MLIDFLFVMSLIPCAAVVVLVVSEALIVLVRWACRLFGR